MVAAAFFRLGGCRWGFATEGAERDRGRDGGGGASSVVPRLLVVVVATERCRGAVGEGDWLGLEGFGAGRLVTAGLELETTRLSRS